MRRVPAVPERRHGQAAHGGAALARLDLGPQRGVRREAFRIEEAHEVRLHAPQLLLDPVPLRVAPVLGAALRRLPQHVNQLVARLLALVDEQSDVAHRAFPVLTPLVA